MANEAADSLRSKAYAKIVDLVCEGEIQGLVDGDKSIFLNGTPLQNNDGSYNFSGLAVDSRTGSQGQPYISGFPSVESDHAVNLEVKTTASIVQTITNPTVNAARVTIFVPSLSSMDSTTGDISGTSVNFAIDVQSNGGGYVEKINDTISGKASSKYSRAYRIELTGSAPWDIRVRRITADATTQYLQNKTYFGSYTEIIDAKLRYPNSALVAVRFDAAQFQSIPARSYDVKLLKVKIPSNYNPTTRAYTGLWDGTFTTAWTDNPAWCFYDLLTNARYGLGNNIAAGQVDKWTLYTIGKYCDELVPNGFGGTEPRFTCNAYIANRGDAYKVIQDMASVFRSMVYWASGTITMSQDAPSDPVAIFTNANVVDGTFTYSGSGQKARHTVALVRWNDPSNDYKQAVEYVEDRDGISRYGYIETDVTAFGCTSRGQANRVGRWMLYSERLETDSVSFKVGLEGAVARPGHVIKIADKERAGARQGGRVVSATYNTITVDNAPDTPIGGTIYVVSPDGSILTGTVSAAAGTTLTVSSAFSTIPQTNSTWVLSTTAVAAQTFRVVSVVESEQGLYEISAISHNPDKYAAIENNLTLETRDITNFNALTATPTNLTASESLYLYQAEVRVKVSASWDQVNLASGYRVDWSKDGGNYTTTTVTNNDFELLNITPGVYRFNVWSINSLGKLSNNYATFPLTVYGKTLPPGDVTGFSNVIDPNIGVTLRWDANTDVDLFAYEVRQGADWDSSVSLGQIKGTSFPISSLPTGSTTFWIKALDTSGIYSANPVSQTITISAASAPTVTGTFVGPNYVMSWASVAGTLATQNYEIRYGASWAAGTVVGNIQTTTYTLRVDWSGTRTYWIAAKDAVGNYGAPGNVAAIVAVPSAPSSIIPQVIDNNVLLQWSESSATLPIDHYEIRKGSTWASATVIGPVSARFTTVFESASATYTYWVAGYDTAGNEGTPASVSAQVNQPPDYQLQADYNSPLNGTLNNAFKEDGTVVLPFDTTETWASHFTSRSWTTIQNQISAGFPYYIEPSSTAGYYEEIIDYGSVFAASKITATLSSTVISGTPAVTCTISVRKLSTDPWTDYPGLSSVFTTDFRYAKIKYAIASSGGDDILQITGLNVRCDVKLRNDAGMLTANSADSGGTTAYFTIPFVDVQSITVTPKGTSACYAIYDFVDAPNPTSFKVLVFNNSGTRITADVSWSAKGV